MVPRRKLTFVLVLILVGLLSAASLVAQDASIEREALWHDSRDDLYRTPGGAAPLGTTITLRLRAAAGDLDSASVRVYRSADQSQTLLPMTVTATTPDGYDLWEAAVDVGQRATVYYYRFLVTKGDETLYYEDDTRPGGFDYVEANKGGVGTVYEQSPDLSFQISAYDPDFYTPEWMRNAVVYQIFPDRFRNGDTANDPVDGTATFYGELALLFHETWNETPVDGRLVQAPSGIGYFNSDFYGGDLAGIIEKLDYLEALGVTALYLNPIFEARSNHRYDTADYFAIDPMLGDLETFRALVAEADARGMKIILDGVFNHLSSDSRYFDRYRRFVTNGACESVGSPWREWFLFIPPRAGQPSACVDTPTGETFYTSWAGFDTIPKINSTLIETRRFFFLDDDSVARTWGREGIGGWRLDVANEIDDGRNPSDLYWEAFRTVVRDENPEAVIVGEFWNDASEWLLGDEWDSTMNYRFRRAIIGFARDEDFLDNDGRIPALTPSAFDAQIRSVAEDYPPMAYYALMNLLDSHDTTRVLSALDGDLALQQLAALAQFTLPGAPTIYYGDEIGIEAPSIPDAGGVLQDDPYNRAPYPWEDTSGSFYPAPNEDMLSYYQTLGTMRRDNSALREGSMTTLLIDDAAGIYAFLRVDTAAGNAALVVLNNSSSEQTVDLSAAGLLPNNLTLQSPFTEQQIDTGDGSLSVTVPANSGDVWTVTAANTAFDAPVAPENVVAQGDTGSINVTWDAADGAELYVIYRSPVAVGGFEMVAETPETTFTDTAVANGYVYHYAVASIGENGMEGTMSGSAFAAPSSPVDRVFFIDADSTTAREVTLSYGLSVDYEAAIDIVGVTDAEGQAEGVRAEAALATDSDDAETLDWQPMTYTGEQDGADVYSASLTPQTPGTYDVVVRFSTDAGINWLTTTVGDSAALPLLVVLASDDTTAPDAPATITMGRAMVSGVSLEWEAVPDEGLAAYRLYRTDTATGETVLLAELTSDTTSFTDVNVTQGQQLSYAVSAVDSALNESTQIAGDTVSVERASVAVTFVVTVPEETGSEPPVHIVGDFRTEAYSLWNNNDPALEMTQVDDTHWSITLFLAEGSTIEYKFVRPLGSDGWGGVEKAEDCSEIANRRAQIVPDADGNMTVDDLVVVKWRDLGACG